jgi:hypothetical protein
VGGEIFFDLVDQVRNRMERTAAQGIVCQFPEPALDEVQPRGGSRGVSTDIGRATVVGRTTVPLRWPLGHEGCDKFV